MLETNKKAIKLFLLITVALSVVWETVIILTGEMGYAAFLMWVPAFAALIAKLTYFRKEKHALLFAKSKIKYILLAVLLPLIYLGVPYLIYWMINPGSMRIEWGIQVLVMAVIGIVISMLTALGEEIGWRGFLVPRLLTWLGLEKTLLLTGLIWGLWHCPLLISGIYMPGTPNWFKVPMFLIIIGAVGVMIGILTLRAKSVWPAAIMHAAHNNFDQVILGAGTVGNNKMYFVSKSGIFTAVIAVTLAIWMYCSYKKELKNSVIEEKSEA